MNKEIIAACLLSYAAAVSVNVCTTPSYAHSRVTKALFIPLGLPGIVAGWLAVYLFINSSGLLYGLIYFVASAIASFLISSRLDDGVMSLFGFVCLVIGLWLGTALLLGGG